jgi:hypothetical protein
LTNEDHRIIDAENIAERYVTGRLSAEEAALFEEHYLDCPACCARVEAAERLERGLKRLAEEAAAGVAVRPVPPLRWRLAAAALFLLALLPAGYELREVVRLRGDLAQTRDALAQAQKAAAGSPERLAATETELEAARRDLAAGEKERATLAGDLAAARRPQAHLPVLSLTQLRGGPSDTPVRTLTLPREPGWVALWVEPGGADFPTYRAALRNERGAMVFEESGLALNDLGALLVTLHSSSLPPGTYHLDLAGLPRSGPPVSLARFPLRIAAAR